MEDIVTNGLESPRLLLAALAYKKLISDMAAALADSEWLVGGKLSLADFAMLPYICLLYTSDAADDPTLV